MFKRGELVKAKNTNSAVNSRYRGQLFVFLNYVIPWYAKENDDLGLTEVMDSDGKVLGFFPEELERVE